MTEDEACELLLSHSACYFYGMGWWIVTSRSEYGNTGRNATPEEAQVLDKVKATVMGQPDPEVAW